MRITKISEKTGAEHTREINVTFYQMWAVKQPGAVYDDIAPQLTAEDLLFLQHGITLEEVDPQREEA